MPRDQDQVGNAENSSRKTLVEFSEKSVAVAQLWLETLPFPAEEGDLKGCAKKLEMEVHDEYKCRIKIRR